MKNNFCRVSRCQGAPLEMLLHNQIRHQFDFCFTYTNSEVIMHNDHHHTTGNSSWLAGSYLSCKTCATEQHNILYILNLFPNFLIFKIWYIMANFCWKKTTCGVVQQFFVWEFFSIVNPNNFAIFSGNIQQIFDIIKMEKKKPTRVKKKNSFSKFFSKTLVKERNKNPR